MTKTERRKRIAACRRQIAAHETALEQGRPFRCVSVGNGTVTFDRTEELLYMRRELRELESGDAT